MHGYIQLILPADYVKFYCTSIKFRELNFRVFDWQENLWDINFCGHGGVVGTIIVGFAKYASYCGLIFVDKRHTYHKICEILCTSKIFMRTVCFAYVLKTLCTL